MKKVLLSWLLFLFYYVQTMDPKRSPRMLQRNYSFYEERSPTENDNVQENRIEKVNFHPKEQIGFGNPNQNQKRSPSFYQRKESAAPHKGKPLTYTSEKEHDKALLYVAETDRSPVGEILRCILPALSTYQYLFKQKK